MVAGFLGAQAPFPTRCEGLAPLGAKILHCSVRRSCTARCEWFDSSESLGFLGAEAPKQREKDREGRGEGKKKLISTVVSFPPHINTYIPAIYCKINQNRVIGASPLTKTLVITTSSILLAISSSVFVASRINIFISG